MCALQEITIAGVDNEISSTRLQTSLVTSQLKRLRQSLDEQAGSMQRQQQLLSHAEAEITQHNALIERKQTQIDQLNKKIELQMSKMEGVSYARVADLVK